MYGCNAGIDGVFLALSCLMAFIAGMVCYSVWSEYIRRG